MSKFADITYPESFNYNHPYIPGPADDAQRKLWEHIEAEVDALSPTDFSEAVNAALVSADARPYERRLLFHLKRPKRRAGLVLFRVRTEGDGIAAGWRNAEEPEPADVVAAPVVDEESTVVVVAQPAVVEQPRPSVSARDAAAARRRVLELGLVKAGPGGRLVAKPVQASEVPPLPAGIDKLRRPPANLLASVEHERRAFVRSLHRSGAYDGLGSVLATNMGTDGTVADGLRPLKQNKSSVFDLEFCLRVMTYVRAIVSERGIDLTVTAAAA